MAGRILLLLPIGFFAVALSQQHTPYSLQSAVDALHRREAQLALRENYEPSRGDDGYEGSSDYPPYRGSRQQLNKILADYLAREEDHENPGYGPAFDYEEYINPEEKKRSMFREREDLPYQTVFRERETDIQPDLAEAFLREIEHEKNLEREEKYRDTLRHLWEKYQQQENEIENELFEDERKHSEPIIYDKRRPYSDMGASYWSVPQGMDKKKRNFPILPWLPATRKKRFPVAKRSPKPLSDDVSATGTNDKVAKDLQAIFGETSPQDDKKKKRSSDEVSDLGKNNKADKKNDHSHHDENKHDEDENEDHHDHDQDLDHEHDHAHAQEHDDDEDFDESDSDDDDKKKKRAVKSKRSNLEVVKEDQIIPGDISDFKKKKSVDWSNYFGMDRRKKSDWMMNKFNGPMKKKSNDEFPLHSFKNHDEFDAKKKKDVNVEKIDDMDKKLKTIEDLIIDETIKYTGAHEGISDPEDIRKLKDHVISRLATAYSLEKMRRALEKLRQTADDDLHLQQNEIETDAEKKKRVATKKEKVEFDNNHHHIESATEKVARVEPTNGLEETDEDKKKKKRNGYEIPNDSIDFEEELGAGHFEPMSEGYMGGRPMIDGSNQCPLLDAMEKRCRSIDLLSGDVKQELLTACGIHQMCYLCGTSQSTCDFQYLSEADSVCGPDTECQAAARSSLMILRGSSSLQLGPRECAKNPCLYRVLRKMGV